VFCRVQKKANTFGYLSKKPALDKCSQKSGYDFLTTSGSSIQILGFINDSGANDMAILWSS
jgi:hypothetical protein